MNFTIAVLIALKRMPLGQLLCTTLMMYLMFQRLRTVGNIFIANLALADLFVNGIVNPFAILGSYNNIIVMLYSNY